jgi:formyltetrahydrofolate deformylase
MGAGGLRFGRSLKERFGSIAAQFSMTWQVEYSDRIQIIAIFVSSQVHCLADLLHRHQTGELNCRICLVISNHRQAEPLTRYFEVPFFHLPVTPETKGEVEQQQLASLADHSVTALNAGDL